ncbi:MAG: hypothetical protein H7201_11100 [Candidatus Saccharibacteria bacterium]|nr:hypothetical protein [Microbacteriaceae bacterium]
MSLTAVREPLAQLVVGRELNELDKRPLLRMVGGVLQTLFPVLPVFAERKRQIVEGVFDISPLRYEGPSIHNPTAATAFAQHSNARRHGPEEVLT